MLHSCPEYVLIGEKGREEPIINSTAEFDENLNMYFIEVF